MAPPLLVASSVSKHFGRKRVLADASLELHAGEAIALVGENGAGKTTLLRICAGLLAPDTGTVSRAGRIGYCPQEPGLVDLLTADEHLAYFGRGVGMSRDDAIASGRRLLADFGFPATEASVVKDLSGGTQQKVNLVLALLGDPPLLLLDEPYQGFDRGTYVNFWDHVDRWRADGKGVLVVTHMLAELTRVDRVVELQVND